MTDVANSTVNAPRHDPKVIIALRNFAISITVFNILGFTVLGFPSNQFLQELGSSEAIDEYCSTTWGVTFPMSEKVKVNGKGGQPVYVKLAGQDTGRCTPK